MKNEDFSNCLIDFTLCPKETPLTSFFPELSAFSEFANCQNDNEIKIAIATTDMDSPCMKITDRESMLKSLFDFLGLPLKNDHDREFFDKVFYYKHERIAAAKARYTQMQHVTDWAQWLAVLETFTFLIFESNRPKENDESIDKYVARRVRIKEDLKKTGKDLKELEAVLFPDSKSAREIAMNEAKKIRTYPEMYAQDRQVV